MLNPAEIKKRAIEFEREHAGDAERYDPLSMPPALLKAHRDLDAAVDKCYRKEPFRSELERVEFLFALYEQYTETLTAGAGAKKRGKGEIRM